MASSEKSLFGELSPPLYTVSDPETELYSLALSLIPGLGPRRGARLLQRFGSARAIFEAHRRDLESCGLSGTVAQSIASACTFDDAVMQQERARACGTVLLPFSDSRYPATLREIPDPPLLLFARGRIELLEWLSIGVVGTRRPSSYGKAAAAKLTRELAELGLVVVSGMARGIDTIAHQNSIDGSGGTIAVFGCGVDVIYPAENRALAESISQKGLILSEYAMGSPSYPQNFPVRNRIVSGISSGILVVEGAQYSGSAITARIAMEQGRPVFAVPGNITSRMSWGPNLLIKQGATLVQDASDILNEMDTQERVRLYQRLYGEPRSTESTAAEKEDRPEDWGPSETRVLRALRVDEGQTLDDLMEELPDTSSSEIIAALFQLEMQGAVKQDAGQRYIKLWC